MGARGSGNLIVQGENLSALSAMQAAYRGQVRCVYIDPPYNNQEDYTHYSDGLDSEVWLKELELRLELLFPLLAEDGSLWISIDDRELHYLKVACDRLFGRDSFVATIVWQHRKSRENRRVFSFNHEYILVYAPDPVAFGSARNDLPLDDVVLDRYKNPDSDPRGPWQSISANVQAGHGTPSQFYELVAPSGSRFAPPNGRCWVYTKDRMEAEIAAGNVWFGRDGRGVPRLKKFLSEAKRGLTPQTVWGVDEVGSTQQAKKHLLDLFPGHRPFDTPKPETLIARILDIATNEGDLVLDSYLGSGTTAAVAHKMSRRYIGVELGDHAASICAARLSAVAAGEAGGISAERGWAGGGAFEFVRH